MTKIWQASRFIWSLWGRYCRAAFVVFCAATTVQGIGEAIIMACVGGIVGTHILTMRRKLRESEMLASAWQTDADYQKAELVAERLHALRLTKANIKLSQHICDLLRPDYRTNGETK